MDKLLTKDELVRGISRMPEARKYSFAELNVLYQTYVPNADVAYKVYTKLYMSLQQSIERKKSIEHIRNINQIYKGEYLGNNQGNSWSLIGESGIGKTALLNMCTQVITKNELIRIKTDNAEFDIIPILIVETPPDASVKTLLFTVLEMLNEVLGFNYKAQLSKNATTEDLFRAVRTASTYIGILVLDEANMLSDFRQGSTLINYMTALANTGLSVCLSGTPELLEFLTSADMSLARRYSPIIIDNFKFDKKFESFISVLLGFQFLETVNVLDYSISSFIYNATGGNTSVILELIYQANLCALESCAEELKLEHFRMAYENNFKSLFRFIETKTQEVVTTRVGKAEARTSSVRASASQGMIINVCNRFRKDRTMDVVAELRKSIEVVELYDCDKAIPI